MPKFIGVRQAKWELPRLLSFKNVTQTCVGFSIYISYILVFKVKTHISFVVALELTLNWHSVNLSLLSLQSTFITDDHWSCYWESPSHFLSDRLKEKKSSFHLELWEPSPCLCSGNTLFKSENFLNKETHRQRYKTTLLSLQFTHKLPPTVSFMCIFK